LVSIQLCGGSHADSRIPERMIRIISRFESGQSIGVVVISPGWCKRHGDQRLSGLFGEAASY